MMSFSLKVKEELSDVIPAARHCQIAELAALISMSGHVYTSMSGHHAVRITTENGSVARRCQMIIHKAFGYESDVAVRYNKDTQNTIYIMSVVDSDVAIKILLATRLMDNDGSFSRDLSLVNTVGISNMCCKRAFLRGAFLAGGSISDPEKYYHLEIVTSSPGKAEKVVETMKAFELDARIVERRRYYVVYLKEGSQIVDMLGVMGARVSLLDLENVRVVKEVRNSINRQVNCETANLGKTINAAVKQIEDINYIKDTIGLDSLNEGLKAIAMVRLEYPDTPLKDLGAMLTPEVGKSGVNHRLRRIGQIAEELRQSNNANKS